MKQTSKQASLFSARGLTLGMVLFQLLKGCLSIVLVMLSASLFGAGIHRDAWVIAWSIQVLIFKLLFGPINEIFRSKYIHLKEEQGEAFALNAAFSLLLVLCIVSLFLVVLLSFFKESIVSVFAPGYQAIDEITIIGRLIVMVLPLLILSQMITQSVALLNSYRTFYLPEFFSLISLGLNILLLYFGASVWGIDTLVIANYASAFILLICLIAIIYKNKFYPQNFTFKLSSVSPFLVFSLPLYFSYAAGQINAWAERVMVSFLHVGNTSALDYARKFIDLPITIIIAIGTTVMTPLLASIWVKESNTKHFQNNFFIFLRMGLLLISPIVMLFSICSGELIELLLHRGRFTTEWIAPTAHTLNWFGWGLFGVVFYVISGQVLIVQKKMRLYSVLGIVAQLFPVLCNALYVKQYGLPIFGMSWCITQYLIGFILFYNTKAFNKLELKHLLKIVFSILISVAIVLCLHNALLSLTPLLTIVVLTSTFIVALLFLMYLFKTEELILLKKEILAKR